MTADDLTRRAIIAAHHADWPRSGRRTYMPGLSRRERAIVELWRAERERVRALATAKPSEIRAALDGMPTEKVDGK